MFNRNCFKTKHLTSTKFINRKLQLLKSKGFTLIELLVSLVLGLVVLGGVLSIFSGTQQSFRVNENLARVQENARLSFELLSREIREAGSTPCGTRAMANVIRVAGTVPWYADWQAGTIIGFDGAQSSDAIAAFGIANLNRVSGTDAIIALRNISDESSIRTVTKHDVAIDSFEVQPKPFSSYAEADLISVCDVSSGAILQVGTVPLPTSSLSEIEYKLGTLNCSVNLGYPTGTCATPPPGKTFTKGALITRYDPVFWYVGFNSDGKRSLYRANVVTLKKTGIETATVVRQEMIPSIQDMQIEYLVKDSAAGNTLVSDWITASNSVFEDSGKWGPDNLKQVVATRLTLTLNSEDKVGATGQLLRREFISVSALRSRDIP